MPLHSAQLPGPGFRIGWHGGDLAGWCGPTDGVAGGPGFCGTCGRSPYAGRWLAGDSRWRLWGWPVGLL